MTVFEYRDMREEDIPEVVELFGEFFYQSKMAEIGDIDKHYVADLLSKILKADAFFAKVALADGDVQGVITALLSPSLFRDAVTCYEQVWYIREKYRGTRMGLHLLAFLQKWAKDKGASFINLGTADGVSNVDKLYQRVGYTKINSNYMGIV